MEARTTFAASGRRAFSLSEKQKDIRKIEIPKAFVKATEAFSFKENNTSEDILATTGNAKHKQDGMNSVTMQNIGLAVNNDVIENPEVVIREPRPRITRRMSSTIRRIQDKIRKEQLKDNNNNDVTVKSDRDGQHPQHQPLGYRSVAKSAVAAVRSARRQRSMSRTKQGKIRCDQLQRPYRRWLGVSTCVAPDTRFIVGPKQDDVVSGRAVEKCKNNNETNDGSENCSENVQQHSSRVDPDARTTENADLVEVEESGCGSHDCDKVDFDEVNLPSCSQSKSVWHQTRNDDDSVASEQSTSSTNQSNKARRPKQRRKLLRFRESKSSPPPNLERNSDALDENDLPVLPLVESTKEATVELALPTGEDCDVRQSVPETELCTCPSKSQPSDLIEAVTHTNVESLPQDDHHTEIPVPFEFSLQLAQNDEFTSVSEGLPVNCTSNDNVNLELEKEVAKSYSLDGKECEKFLSILEFTPQTREEKPAQDETMKHACMTNDKVGSFVKGNTLELAHEETDEEKSYHSEVAIQLLGKDIEIDCMTPNQGIQTAEMAPQCENSAMGGQCLSDDTSLQQDQGKEKDDSTSGQFIEGETKETVVNQCLFSLKDESGLSELIPRSKDQEKDCTATKSQTSDEESVPLTQEDSLIPPGSVEEEHVIERCGQSTNSDKRNTESSTQQERAEIEKEGTESQLRSSADDENCVPKPLGCSSRPKQDATDGETTAETLDSIKEEYSPCESSQFNQDQMRDANTAEHQCIIVDASHVSPSTTSSDLRNKQIAIDSAIVVSPTINLKIEPLGPKLSYKPEGKPENESETTPMHIAIEKVHTTKSECSTKRELEETIGHDGEKSYRGQSKAVHESLSPPIKIIKPTKKERTKKDQSSLTSPSISNAAGFPVRTAKSAECNSPSFHPADNASDQGGLAGKVVSKATFNVYPPVPPLPPATPPSQRATNLHHYNHPTKQFAKAAPRAGGGTATTRGYHAKGNSLRQEMRTFRDRQLFEVKAFRTPSSYTIRTLTKKVKKGLEKKEYINVQAIKDCEGTLPGQLAFRKGQVIKQLDTGLRDVDGMFYGYYRVGRLRRKVWGIYPSTHVSLFFESDEEPDDKDNEGGDGRDGDCGKACTGGAVSAPGVGGNGGCDGFKRDGLHSQKL